MQKNEFQKNYHFIFAGQETGERQNELLASVAAEWKKVKKNKKKLAKLDEQIAKETHGHKSMTVNQKRYRAAKIVKKIGIYVSQFFCYCRSKVIQRSTCLQNALGLRTKFGQKNL